MSEHRPSKHQYIHDGTIEWSADCSCGWGHLLRLEEEADIYVRDHLSAVERERQRLARAYAEPLEDDGFDVLPAPPDKQAGGPGVAGAHDALMISALTLRGWLVLTAGTAVFTWFAVLAGTR